MAFGSSKAKSKTTVNQEDRRVVADGESLVLGEQSAVGLGDGDVVNLNVSAKKKGKNFITVINENSDPELLEAALIESFAFVDVQNARATDLVADAIALVDPAAAQTQAEGLQSLMKTVVVIAAIGALAFAVRGK